MSMTGGISFFDKNRALFKDGASAVASSNTDDQNLILGQNKYYSWQSNGSDDMTTETITITLAAAISISRIFLVNHNFKAFQIQYDNGSPTDFANVAGLDSYSGNSIDVTNFSRNTAYFEFDAVTTDTIIITVDTTQTVGAEKVLGQFIATNEIGTLTGYPVLNRVRSNRNIKRERSVTGRNHIQKGFEVASFDLNLQSYPLQADIDILDSLHQREDNFLVWLCGGKPDQFRLTQRGFLIDDIYEMQVTAPLENGYKDNVYRHGVQQKYNFEEAI